MMEERDRILEWMRIKSNKEMDEMRKEKYVVGMVPRRVATDLARLHEREEELMREIFLREELVIGCVCERKKELRGVRLEIGWQMDKVRDELVLNGSSPSEQRERIEYLQSRVLSIHTSTRTVYDVTQMWDDYYEEE